MEGGGGYAWVGNGSEGRMEGNGRDKDGKVSMDDQ